MRTVNVNNLFIGEGAPLTVIAGPCVIESESHALHAAEHLLSIFTGRPIQFIFQASYDKANRSSLHSFRGPGIEEGLKILEKIKETFHIPILTDVHCIEEAREAATLCDILQIPAFLCRQTDLIVEAAKCSSALNIKKGQFMAPGQMKQVVEKILSTGNENILLTERGSCFGYNNLVVDMRAIPMMQELGYPVIFDATHSVQRPGALGEESGGERQFIAPLARAAIAAGCNGIYAETHQDPAHAKSDSALVIAFADLPYLLDEWQILYEARPVSCSKLNV